MQLGWQRQVTEPAATSQAFGPQLSFAPLLAGKDAIDVQALTVDHPGVGGWNLLERVSASRVWSCTLPHHAHTYKRGIFQRFLRVRLAIVCFLVYRVCGARRSARPLAAAAGRCNGFGGGKRDSLVGQL